MQNQMKKLLTIVILFAATAIFIFSGAAGWVLRGLAGSPTAAPVGNPAAAAAELGVATVFTLDQESGIAGWRERVCAVSTPAGCAAIPRLFADGLAGQLEIRQTDLTCTATAVKLSRDNGEEQIWIVEAVTTGWEEEKTELIAVAVTRTANAPGWQLDEIIPGIPQQVLVQMLTPTAVP